MDGFSEILKPVADVMKPPVETASKLLEKLAGQPCEIAGEMVGDLLRNWQWQQRVKMLNKAQAIIANDEIAVKAIPPGFLLPLLEAVGNVEDDDLQALWANLLASAVEDESTSEPAYIHALKVLSARDAKLILRIKDSRLKAVSVDASVAAEHEYWTLPKEELNELGFQSSNEFWASVSKLGDLVVLKPESEKWVNVEGQYVDPQGFLVNRVWSMVIEIKLSCFGAAFINKVTRTPVEANAISVPGELMSRAIGLGSKGYDTSAKLMNLEERRRTQFLARGGLREPG